MRVHIERNNLLSEFQSGFRNNHRCTTALMRVLEDIKINIKNNKLTVLVLLDIKSAYPSVSHNMLMMVLSLYGLSVNTQQWVGCFLNDKTQVVELNNVRSKEININCGLLQGDNLSKTFFSLVINNDVINEISFCKAHLYVDDLAVYIEIDINSFDESISKINEDIDRINKFIENRGMHLNSSKSKSIIIGNKRLISSRVNSNNLSKIKVCELKINYSDTVKYLGFNFNSSFNSENHVNVIIKNVNFVLSKIKNHRRSLSTNVKLKLLKGIIDPFFDYCAIIYHGYGVHGTGGDQNRLRILYNSALRFVCDLSGRDHVSIKYAEINILNDLNRRSLLICVIIHTFIHGGKPTYLLNIFKRNINNTRAGADSITLKVEAVFSVKDELLLAHSACRLWNSIPSEIRNIESKNKFSDSLKSHFLEQQKNQSQYL